MKPTTLTLFRFVLSMSLIGCLWFTSIVFRSGSWAHNGSIGSDWFLVITALALFVATYRQYNTDAISTVLIYLVCIIIITALDTYWESHDSFDGYKGLENYTIFPMISSLVVALTSFLLVSRREPNRLVLALSWSALILTVFAIGNHALGLGYGMIGSRYIIIILVALVGAELARHYRRWKAEYDV